MRDLEKKIKYIAYVCFAFATLGLIVAIVRIIEGGLTSLVVFGTIISLLWYQAGAGLLKRGKNSRILAIVLFVLYAITFLLSSYYIFIRPSVNDSFVDSTSFVTRWFILALGLISLYCVYVLINKKTKNIFNTSSDQNNQLK